MNKKKLTLNIKELSHALGFDLVGISQAKKNIKASEHFQKWLDMGYHGSMNWLTNRKEEKKDIFKYFPQVKSVISFGYNYYSSSNFCVQGMNVYYRKMPSTTLGVAPLPEKQE